MPQDLKSIHPQKISILRRNGLGDLLMSLPMLYVLKEELPEAKIELIVEDSNASILPFVQNPPWDTTSVLRRGNKYLSIFFEALRLRKSPPDLIISAKPTPMKLVNLFFALSGAKTRRATTGFSWHNSLINWPIEEDKMNKIHHQALKLVHLATQREGIDPSNYPVLSAKETSFTALIKKSFEEAHFFKQDAVNVYVALTNNRAESNPSPQQIIHLFKKSHHAHLNVILATMPGDENKGIELKALLKKECVDLPVIWVVTESLGHCLELMELSDVIFTGDGGTMHLAAALQKPQLVLFGGTSVRRWHPLSELASCLAHEKDVKELDSSLIQLSFENQVELVLKAKRSSSILEV